jgi:hypothetical protein
MLTNCPSPHAAPLTPRLRYIAHSLIKRMFWELISSGLVQDDTQAVKADEKVEACFVFSRR